MSDPVGSAGLAVVEAFGACAAAPDDLDAAARAAEALTRLDELLAEQDAGQAA